MEYLIHHLLSRTAARLPEKEAIAAGGVRRSYSEVLWAVNGFACGLRAAGLEPGDRIGILLPPSISQALSIFAVSMAGGVFVPIHDSLFPDQVVHILSDCSVTALITTSAKLAGLVDVLQRVPSLKFLVVADEEKVATRLPVPVYSLAQWPAMDGSVLKNVCIEKDLAAILYTSGSTGKPKGIMVTHAQLIAGATIVSSYLGITENDSTLAVLPFTFDAGLNQLLTAFQKGGTIVISDFKLARDLVQILKSENITGLVGVPTLWHLLAHPNSTLQKAAVPALRYIANTGGALSTTVVAALRKMLPATAVFLMYGLTEAFRSTYLPPEELDRRPNSIGKAIPNTEILVIDDSGELCPPGVIGELVHRGPTVALGYWGKPELTAQVFRPHPFALKEIASSEQVCYSGDLVKTDEEGFLYFVGRRDNMIKTSGFRVSPTEIEEVLLQTGSVQDAAVIGCPDEILGQHIKAFVVSNNSGSHRDAEFLIRFCSEKLPRYMIPQTIEFLGELPRTANGKVDYSSLKRRGGETDPGSNL